MAEREILGKLALRDLGTPAKVTAMSPDELAKTNGRYYMGLLFGKATEIITRTDPKTEEAREGLGGVFIMRPSDATQPEKEAGILWIPDSFHNLVATKLRDVQQTDKNAGVEFAFDVSSIKANNPIGYSWAFTPAIPFEGKHPLEGMMERVSKAKQAQLEAPKGEQKAAARK